MQKNTARECVTRCLFQRLLLQRRVKMYHKGKKDDTESGASTFELCWQLLLHGKIRNKTKWKKCNKI